MKLCPFVNQECNLKAYKRDTQLFVCTGDLDCQNKEPVIKESKYEKLKNRGQSVLA
jgi:hypothetical protein